MTFCGSDASLKKLGVRPSKQRGQNFLHDEKLADWMVEQAGILSGERVLEIGPGLGILTGRLLDKTHNLIVVEVDKKLARYIEGEYGIEVIQGDAVQIDIPDFDRVVSNLPYQISSPMTFKLLDHDFAKGILMYQKEFAEHLVAQPGNRAYSRISVMTGWRAECRIIKHVQRGSFNPVPKVDSAIVEIVPREADFEVRDPDTFKKVVRALFSHKNRKVRNGIVSEHRALGLDKGGAKELAEKLPHHEERPVKLEPSKLADIANTVAHHLST